MMKVLVRKLGHIAWMFACTALHVQAAVIFSVSGASPAAIQGTVDSFRTALGAQNANVAGSFPGGRREINWDGVPNQFSAPNFLPGNFFNVNSPRGIVLSTPGVGFETSASASSSTAVRFGNVDPSYPAQFQAFSAERLFRAVQSNIFRIDFFVPGSTTPATVSGFGAVFTDVELAASTTITLFLGDGTAGGTFSPPPSASGGLSFFGITESRRISRVLIQSGNRIMGAGASDNPGAGFDVVAVDDLIYGEPQKLATLDIDLSISASKYDALTDGLLVIRYLFGLTGPQLANAALGSTATRTDPASIKSYLDLIRPQLDIDANSNTDALTDGLLILRYLFGVRGNALINGAFDPLGTRNTATAIEAYITSLMP